MPKWSPPSSGGYVGSTLGLPDTELCECAWVLSLSVAHRLRSFARSGYRSSKNVHAAGAREMVPVGPAEGNRIGMSGLSRDKPFVKVIARIRL